MLAMGDRSMLIVKYNSPNKSEVGIGQTITYLNVGAIIDVYGNYTRVRKHVYLC